MNRLDRLLKAADVHVHGVLLGLKRPLAPVWVLVDEKDHIALIATPWRNAIEKQAFVEQMRGEMKQRKTVAYSLAMEAWAAFQPGASQRPDRIEVVIAVATDGKETKGRQWKIKRDWNEAVYALEAMSGDADDIQGSLTELLEKAPMGDSKTPK